MADKNTIKNWFLTGLKPTQAQFRALFDSYWHKDETIPITAITDIEAILNAKADAEALINHVGDVAAHAALFLAKEDKTNKGIANGYAPLDEFIKIASQYLTIVDDLVTGGSNSLLSAEQGKILKTQIDEYSAGAKTYNTYFVNTTTGNDSTGVFEDGSHPYATIDHILGLSTYADGSIIVLQDPLGVFPLNGQIPRKSTTIKSDFPVTLDLSGNNNSTLVISAGTNLINLKIEMPLGILKNDRAGSTGVMISDYPSTYLHTTIDVDEIFNNATTILIDGGFGFTLKVNKVSSLSVSLCSLLSKRDINIKEFICLGTAYSSIGTFDSKVTIDSISGTGTYISSTPLELGNCTSIGGIVLKRSTYFRSSVITGTVDLGDYYTANSDALVISGEITSAPIIKLVGIESHIYGDIHITNFKADLKLGTIRAYGSDVYIDNSSITSTNSPLEFWTGNGHGNITVKNSTFEVVNTVPLCTGGASDSRTLKVAGISTNATMLSDQDGTGVTVTQFTNY